MIPKPRLLILSCSKRKRPVPGLLPAIERYNGPAFRILRRFMREQPDKAGLLDVYILSAAYGLIPADCPIALYDLKITPSRAAELQPEVLAASAEIIPSGGYSHLCLVMGKTYLTALDGWQRFAPKGMKLTVAAGPMGVKLTQLKNWLWEELPCYGGCDETGGY